jgi:ankyrin repeat protein
MEKQKEFFNLCKKGKFEEVKLFLSQFDEFSKNELINFVNKQGNNAIITACQSGNVDLVDFLYKKGADILSENLKTSTLLRAIQSGSHQLVKYLPIHHQPSHCKKGY